jgi:hypothetical protein
MSTAGERNLAAEVRGMEEGHHAWLVTDEAFALTGAGPQRAALKVKSDTKPGKWYGVDANALPAGPVSFTCCPFGDHAYEDDHLLLTGELGIVPCKHAAVAARRLERAGLVHLDPLTGTWLDTREAAPQPVAAIFEGLNG